VYDSKILRMGLTGNARTDALTVVKDDAAIAADLDMIGSDGTAPQATWDKLDADGARGSSDANILRADLGLPPPPALLSTETTLGN
jgi:hypothetical protein